MLITTFQLVQIFNSINSELDKGRLLTPEQAQKLQDEIESYYNPLIPFGQNTNDIRMNCFSLENPLATKTINGIELKIVVGLVRNRRKTYLLYADNTIVGEFYSVEVIKCLVKHIEDNLIISLN